MNVTMMDGAEESVELGSLPPGTCFCVAGDGERLVDATVFMTLRAPKDEHPRNGHGFAVILQRGNLLQMPLDSLVQPMYVRLSVWLRGPEDE